MKLDPRHLVQLAAILDSGTLRVAAERLGTTQPALSRTIAMMEERIGTPLFERSRRPLTPTDTGIELAAFGRTIRGAVERADILSQQVTAGQYGTIRVGAPPFFCDHLVSRIIGEFHADPSAGPRHAASRLFPALVMEMHESSARYRDRAVRAAGRRKRVAVERLLAEPQYHRLPVRTTR